MLFLSMQLQTSSETTSSSNTTAINNPIHKSSVDTMVDKYYAHHSSSLSWSDMYKPIVKSPESVSADNMVNNFSVSLHPSSMLTRCSDNSTISESSSESINVDNKMVENISIHLHGLSSMTSTSDNSKYKHLEAVQADVFQCNKVMNTYHDTVANMLIERGNLNELTSLKELTETQFDTLMASATNNKNVDFWNEFVDMHSKYIWYDDDESQAKLNDIEKTIADHRNDIIDRLFRINKAIEEAQVKQSSLLRKSHIASECTPAFNVDRNLYITDRYLHKNDCSAWDLNSFLNTFEHMFITNEIDVEKNWYFYLKAAFRKSDEHYPWFLKYLQGSTHLSWETVKKMLVVRFDRSTQASVESLALDLLDFTPRASETFTDCMTRFSALIVESKINSKNNVLLLYKFIRSFHGEVRYLLECVLNRDFSKNQKHQQPERHTVPADWNQFKNIMKRYSVEQIELAYAQDFQKAKLKKRKFQDI